MKLIVLMVMDELFCRKIMLRSTVTVMVLQVQLQLYDEGKGGQKTTLSNSV
jgi:hypothetical protein